MAHVNDDRAYEILAPEVDAAILGILETCQFTLGKEVATFEEEFAAYTQSKHGIGVNTGTSALHLALLAAGVGPGDEVITVTFTFVATVAAIHYSGAKPVFVDIDPVTFTMDPKAIAAAITPRTKAIIPVHLYGQPADMDPILEIARRHAPREEQGGARRNQHVAMGDVVGDETHEVAGRVDPHRFLDDLGAIFGILGAAPIDIGKAGHLEHHQGHDILRRVVARDHQEGDEVGQLGLDKPALAFDLEQQIMIILFSAFSSSVR